MSEEYDGRPFYPGEVGFDYAQAVRELNQLYSYEEIARRCGYDSRQGVINIITKSSIPSHPQGEAIWALYCWACGKRPPTPMKIVKPGGHALST